MSESTQHKLSRVRKPRVHITYDVETEGATVTKELPFVVGVLADLSGDPTEPLPSLRDRKFIQIDPDNFNDVLAKMTPGVNVRVPDTLKGEGEVGVQLRFNSMQDFEPGNIVQQVEPLRKLLEVRNRLRDLLTKIDRSEELENILEQCLTDESQLKELAGALEGSGDESSESDATKEETE